MALLDKIGHVLTSDITKDFRFKKRNISFDENLTFIDQLKKRRNVSDLGNKIRFSQTYLTELIQESVRSCPSAYHSQSTRVVILYGNSHKKFWDIVREMQRKIVPAHIFEGIELKMDQCVKAYGTVLFYEDQKTIQYLQKKRPFDAKEFPIWSEQTSGMAQFAVWTALADSDIGASLQHYNPIIDEEIAKSFAIDENWKLRAQLVFGSIEQEIGEKPHIDYAQQFKVFY
ncbi:hypothetical protein A6M14_05520 [Acinetobacter sp. Ac_877]|uniref:nitroreductase family protein n=1 Tax=Acinetobacter portensis TaxID=1839785 RepID=UPI00128E58FE|nr:nitroreductase family protein [Acinetobacter portensis]MPW40766.1 hypothetical protein [Acinetobacter portensis]